MEHTVTIEKVRALYERLKVRGPKHALMGLRTEVHEALQAELPPPYTDYPDHLEDFDHIKSHVKSQVTDAEILASERARHTSSDRTHIDAHHYVQKQHGIALWQEADRLIKAAGIITDGGAS